VFFGEGVDGGWEIEGTAAELRDLMRSLDDAITEGEAEGILLTEDGTITVTITATEPLPE
jgi:hypothetical protein